MDTPGVKWVQLFFKYLHPWSPVFMRNPLSGWPLRRLTEKNIPLVMNLTDKLLYSFHPGGTHFTPIDPSRFGWKQRNWKDKGYFPLVVSQLNGQDPEDFPH